MDYDQCLERIEAMSAVIHRKLEPKLCKGLGQNMSLPLIRFLGCIKTADPCVLTEFANQFGVTLSAITGLVNKLEGMKLVRRLRSEKDRRIVMIEITERGEEFLKIIRKNSVQLFEKCFSSMDREETEIFFKVMDRFMTCILSDNEQNEE